MSPEPLPLPLKSSQEAQSSGAPDDGSTEVSRRANQTLPLWASTVAFG
jgi:hypothetical protein